MKKIKFVSIAYDQTLCQLMALDSNGIIWIFYVDNNGQTKCKEFKDYEIEQD